MLFCIVVFVFICAIACVRSSSFPIDWFCLILPLLYEVQHKFLFSNYHHFHCNYRYFYKFFFISCVFQIPQIILLTFDGAVNLNNYDHYLKIFNGKRTNPNGCVIRGTFFMSHEYRWVQDEDACMMKIKIKMKININLKIRTKINIKIKIKTGIKIKLK